MNEESKPDYVIKDNRTGCIYNVFNASMSKACLVGDFNLQGSNIIVLGLCMLCDIELLDNVPLLNTTQLA